MRETGWKWIRSSSSLAHEQVSVKPGTGNRPRFYLCAETMDVGECYGDVSPFE